MGCVLSPSCIKCFHGRHMSRSSDDMLVCEHVLANLKNSNIQTFCCTMSNQKPAFVRKIYFFYPDPDRLDNASHKQT